MARKTRKKFVYKKVTKDSIDRERKGGGRMYDSMYKEAFSVWAPKEGLNKGRILPPTWEGNDTWAYTISVNYGIGPDESTYLSLSEMGQGKDPVAEERRRAQKKGDGDYAKSLQPTSRKLVWWVDRKEEEKGPQLWAMPKRLAMEIFGLQEDDDDKTVLDIDHPEKGYDINFQKQGQGITTQYMSAKIARKSTPMTDDDELFDQWIEFIQDNPLDSTLNFYSYDHINAVLIGESPADDKDEEEEQDVAEEEEEKASSKTSRRRSVRVVEEADEEDGDAEAETEDDGEDDTQTEAPEDAAEEDEEDSIIARRRRLREMRSKAG